MTTIRFASITAITCVAFAASGCSSNSSKPSTTTGGAVSTGGTAAAGETSIAGSSSVAGSSNGGASTTGGASNGGAATGGASALCTAGQKRCSNLGVPQTCNAGAWQDGTACTGSNYCNAGACVACAGTGGPTMVALVDPGLCIDSTEVTRGQYQTWLNSNPSTSSQTADCTWNTTFVPTDSDWPPTAKLDYPVTGVDWCDAYAFCQGVGKRLCGATAGGPNPYANYKLATGQWAAACTSKGKTGAYPYGSQYSKTACNGNDMNLMETVATGSLTTCQSPIDGFTGVFDLSGNVQEWEDSCDDTTGGGDAASVRCRLRGGSFLSMYDGLSCYTDFFSSRSYSGWDIGFRCCSK